MLRQLPFELLGQQPLGHLRAGADDTALEMREERGRGRGIEAAALIVEQGGASGLTVHGRRHAHGA